ncbi:MAG: hypothetical protein IJ904_04635 [Candidatus Methanomethylophilaceae archaeon]|nr:hypothetical protein [Candidatus Methanomethylophilaceae archaeon]
MKNNYHLIAAAMLTLCLAGCNGRQSVETPADNLIHTTIRITGSPETRVTDVTSTEEDNIKNL